MEYYIQLTERRWLGRNGKPVPFNSELPSEEMKFYRTLKGARNALIKAVNGIYENACIVTIDWSVPHCPSTVIDPFTGTAKPILSIAQNAKSANHRNTGSNAMKISEMIKDLTELLNKEGDLEVLIEEWDDVAGEMDASPAEMNVKTTSEGKTLVIT